MTFYLVLAAAILAGFAFAAWRTLALSAARRRDERASLFETDEEKITLKSADNVRLLSDDQIRELERADE